MNRRSSLATAAVLSLVTAGAVPALASSHNATGAKAVKGTFSYTDATPDPTVDASLSSDVSQHCHGKLPSSPTDVNAHTLKLATAGSLTVNASVVGDWAMELRTAKGAVVTGDDANPPATESLLTPLKKGTYSLVMCNLSGAPTATASYTFKPARSRHR